jgi:formate dehydrogenase major subunit
VPGLGTSFGRGGATTFPGDLVNADCIVIEGSNMAECHPVAFQWVVEAKRRGATVIHIDPRFTRTSALADLHVPLRAGSDIVFLGALVNHVLQHDLDFKEYVAAYTNASALVRDDFKDTEELDGVFSGYDASMHVYDPSTWKLTGEHDPTLGDPRCVYQVLRRHFARYTPELVQRVCGVPPELFARVADAVTRNSGRDRTTAFVYSVGWTQHTVGVQYIRTAAILQLLLGNMGRPGGGIMALRGHASIQGSTDIPTLYDLLPGYLDMPWATDNTSLDDYVAPGEAKTGFWGNYRAYTVSLLKAWWGHNARPDNDFCFDYLPRLTGDHGTYQTVADQMAGKVKGYFVIGENPAVGSANGKMQRLGLANLEWLVVRDLTAIETATFWLNAPEIETGELRTEEIGTEVFLMPAAAHTEKDGSFTNTQRLLQWRHKAVDPPGDARSELWFYYHLGRRIRDKLASSTDEMDRPVLDLTWEYPTTGRHDEPEAEAVLAEINGFGPDGKPLSSFTELAADGSTRCGCWIYCGCYAGGVNQVARRRPWNEQSWVAPEWGWSWPANRRVLYNRASADPSGKPWSERKAYVWWDAGSERWTGHDVPDFEVGKAPDYVPPEGARAQEALSGADPFIMVSGGKAALFVGAGIQDGPLPAHYEPVESPVANAVYDVDHNPARRGYPGRANHYHPERSDVFPYVFTTYRLTEHHTAGAMSRTLPYLSELQPEFFCEVSPALAAERGLVHMGWATIVTARSAVEARVVVTNRIPSLEVDGRTIHQIGLPFHWGANGISTGDSANDLLSAVVDPNVSIQEDKASTCDIRPGRRPRGAALAELVEAYRRKAGIDGATDEEAAGGSIRPNPRTAPTHAGTSSTRGGRRPRGGGA